MTINLETLLVALVFVLPGFLTSRLVNAKTPVAYRQLSPFVETFESLLRSLYINIIFVTLGLIFLRNLVEKSTTSALRSSVVFGFISENPFEISFLLILWLALALVLAAIFGAFWDPLDFMYQKLGERQGIEYNDPWYSLRERILESRDKGLNYQLWAQARMKNGDVWQGQLTFVGFPKSSNDREILLERTRVYLLSEKSSIGQPIKPQHFDAVVLHTANIDSIDFTFHEYEEESKYESP